MISSRRELNDSLKTAIIALKAQNMSIRKISESLSIPKSTVGDFLKHFEKENSIKYTKRIGRPKKNFDKMMKTIIKMVENDRKMTSNEIARDLDSFYNIKISPSTIRRRLVKEGLCSRKVVLKPKLSEKQKKSKIQLGIKYKDFSLDDWSNVLFSDESKFELFGGDKQCRMHRRSTENPLLLISETVKFPTTILVWGCFSAKGSGYFKIIEKTLNSEKYIEILEKKLKSSAMRLEIPETNLIYQQDNAPCHTSRSVRKWFEENEIHVMDWPSNSADLNPIENLWSLCKFKLNKQNPKNKQELIENFIKVWNSFSIDPKICSNPIKSMPKRIEEVIKNKGNVINY